MTCEKLKEMCRQAVLPEHKDKAARAQSERVDVAMQYRRADRLVQRWAEEKPDGFELRHPWGPNALRFRSGLDGTSKNQVSPKHHNEETSCCGDPRWEPVE